MENDVFEFTADVDRSAASFLPELESVDAIVPTDEAVTQAEEAILEPVTLTEIADVLDDEEAVAFAAQSLVPGQPDYLLRDSSTWTEDEYSIQLFGEPGHTWAEMGFA